MSTEQQQEPDLIIDETDRYARLRMIGWWDQERIAAARVLVVGAGALGNEVLKNLALLGFGHIHIIDLDTIDPTNLTRSILFRTEDAGQPKSQVAAKMIGEINPDCSVYPIQGNVLTDIGLGLVRDVDVVFGCLDNREARLWVNRMCWKVGSPWIDGGIQEINGVAKVFRPPDGPCYECAMTEMDYKLIQLRYSCPLLKHEDIQQGKVPTAPTIASMIGALQVQEALKLIHDLPTADGTALVFNGLVNNFYQTQYPLKEDCLSHEFYDDPVELPLESCSCTVGELYQAVERATGQKTEALELDRDFLVNLTCSNCDIVDTVLQPQCVVNAQRGICQKCNQPMNLKSLSRLEGEEMVSSTLSELGIPNYDIVKVHTSDDLKFVLLAADRESFSPVGSGGG